MDYNYENITLPSAYIFPTVFAVFCWVELSKFKFASIRTCTKLRMEENEERRFAQLAHNAYEEIVLGNKTATVLTDNFVPEQPSSIAVSCDPLKNKETQHVTNEAVEEMRLLLRDSFFPDMEIALRTRF